MMEPNSTSPPIQDELITVSLRLEDWQYILGLLNDDLIYHYGLIDAEEETIAKKLIDHIYQKIETQ
jgi:hypothetical protein